MKLLLIKINKTNEPHCYNISRYDDLFGEL